MKIDIISDLHGHQPKLEGGDLLIVAGDLTSHNEADQYFEFEKWLNEQKYTKKVVVAGNHDGYLVNYGKNLFQVDIYLEDSGTEFEGLKIWGMPWTKPFYDWYFMAKPKKMKEKLALIPDDTDILITHGPPYGFFDKNSYGEHCGCEQLREEVIKRIKPRLHCFGHLHENGGKMIDCVTTKFINASIMNENYEPVNKPVRIEL